MRHYETQFYLCFRPFNAILTAQKTPRLKMKAKNHWLCIKIMGTVRWTDFGIKKEDFL